MHLLPQSMVAGHPMVLYLLLPAGVKLARHSSTFPVSTDGISRQMTTAVSLMQPNMWITSRWRQRIPGSITITAPATTDSTHMNRQLSTICLLTYAVASTGIAVEQTGRMPQLTPIGKNLLSR